MLREGIAMFADASALLPLGEVVLEVPRRRRRARAVIVVAGDREAWDRLLPDTQHFGGAANLRLEAEGRRVAGEDEMINASARQFVHQVSDDFVRMGESLGPAQDAVIEPGGKSLVQPVLALPLEARRGKMDVAEMRQAEHAMAFLSPSFPRSAWERTSGTLCVTSWSPRRMLASLTNRGAVPDGRSHAERGNEVPVLHIILASA